MGGLRDRIKGLERFRPEIPEQQFESRQGYRLIREALARVSRAYPAGALEWARQHRPELAAAQRAALDDAEAAYAGEDVEGLRRALERFGRAMRELTAAFEAGEVEAPAPAESPPEAIGLFPEMEEGRRRAAQHRGAL